MTRIEEVNRDVNAMMQGYMYALMSGIGQEQIVTSGLEVNAEILADPAKSSMIIDMMDGLVVIGAMYAEELVSQSQLPAQLDAAAAELYANADATVCETVQDMMKHLDQPLPDLMLADMRDEFACAMLLSGGSKPLLAFAISSAAVAAAAQLRLAKLSDALPGLLEAYGAVRAGASAAYTTGAMEEYAMHTEKAKELAAEITALVSGGH